MMKQVIAKVVKGKDLTEEEMKMAMEEIMTGKARPAQIGAFITALRIKGETVGKKRLPWSTMMKLPGPARS